MSRAVLVLDTEFQRRRAQEWVWAAKHGSRVEFKGPKRTDDQNSLMWVLLTEVAVHMRKTAKLEYSTEDWKHIFLHGWGREVRFLPALDGKGVVPVPQSSSDLSKEEMTDFIEYILMEGSKRGVPFQQHSEPSAETARSTYEAAAGVPSPNPAAAPLSAAADQVEAGATAPETAVETGHPGQPASVSTASEREMVNPPNKQNTDFLKAEMVRKVVEYASNGKIDVADRLQELDQIRADWIERIPGHPTLIDQVFKTAEKIVRGAMTAADARKLLGGA